MISKNIGYLFLAISLCLVVVSSESSPYQLPPFTSVSNLPYQAHSFNDIGYIQQLMSRGVKYFKIDVSMANRASCSKNSNWDTSKPCYKTNQYAQEYCCLALKGDTSGRNNFNFHFNTIDDFTLMLTEYLKQNPIEKILFFAINHQFRFSFNNVLVQESTYRLAQLMEQYPKLHIGFGSDDFILEYDRICRTSLMMTNQKFEQIQRQPIQALNSQSCTEKRKLISSSKIFLQSGSNSPSDPRNFYGRYRNFNIQYQGIKQRCQNGFPSWIKKYPQYPLIFWQPSNEWQIQQVLEQFMSETCRLHHGRGLDGLAITSNIDPEVFEFYLKKLKNTFPTSNGNIKENSTISFQPNTEKIALKYASNFLSKFTVLNETVSKEYLVSAQQDQNHTILNLITMEIDSKGQRVAQTARYTKQQQIGYAIKIVGGMNNLALVQKVIKNTTQNEVKVHLLDLNFENIVEPLVDNYVDLQFYRGYYYLLKHTSNPTVFNIIKTKDFQKNSIIQSFSVVLDKAKSIQSFLVFEDKDGKVRVLLSGSINNQVWIAEARGQSLYKSVFVTYGLRSKLTLKESGLIVLSVESGTCNSGVLINNGDTPLCSFYEYPEFLPLTSTRNTVNVIEFSYSTLNTYLETNNKPISPCTPHFVSYKLLNGKNVNIVDLWNKMFISGEYVHISECGLMNSLFCAPSNFVQINTEQQKRGLLGTIWSRTNVKQQTKKRPIYQRQTELLLE